MGAVRRRRGAVPDAARAGGNDAKGRDLTSAVKTTEAFVREQIGDARSFSLDSPKSRAPRIAALRRAG